MAVPCSQIRSEREDTFSLVLVSFHFCVEGGGGQCKRQARHHQAEYKPSYDDVNGIKVQSHHQGLPSEMCSPVVEDGRMVEI